MPRLLFAASLLSLACRHSEPRVEPAQAALVPVAPEALRPPEAFASVPNPRERSRALFVEASRVFLHPRCANCHPDGDSPLQGEAQRRHDPPVMRGPKDEGVVAMECASCHQDHNVELARVPGAPKWHLAPIGMAWVGKSPHALCEQLKDPARNGNRTLPQIIDHVEHDALVAWGWHPGSNRVSAPGSATELGALVTAWMETGAACPEEGQQP